MKNKIILCRRIKKMLNFIKKIKKSFFVIDNKILKKYKNIREKIKKKNFYLIKKPEKSKNIITIEKIINKMQKKKIDKSYKIISIGGGATNDITGFVSSIFYRGIDWVTMPTTILSMVDASIGGKNAVNTNFCKNIIGTIKKPITTFVCFEFIKKNKKLIIEGISEIIKISIINNKKIFEDFKKNSFMNLNKIVYYSIISKIKILKENIKDKGKRLLLNLGHTFAHSIEKVTKNKINHGNAVFIGLYIILFLSKKIGLLIKKKYKNIIKKIKIFASVKKIKKIIKKINFVKSVTSDKKVIGKNINLILIKDLNKCLIKKIKINDFLKISKIINNKRIS